MKEQLSTLIITLLPTILLLLLLTNLLPSQYTNLLPQYTTLAPPSTTLALPCTTQALSTLLPVNTPLCTPQPRSTCQYTGPRSAPWHSKRLSVLWCNVKTLPLLVA